MVGKKGIFYMKLKGKVNVGDRKEEGVIMRNVKTLLVSLLVVTCSLPVYAVKIYSGDEAIKKGIGRMKAELSEHLAIYCQREPSDCKSMTDLINKANKDLDALITSKQDRKTIMKSARDIFSKAHQTLLPKVSQPSTKK